MCLHKHQDKQAMIETAILTAPEIEARTHGMEVF